MSTIRPHTCAEPGPYDTHCSERSNHPFSCYDAGDDSSWNTRQDWTHQHEGCPDDGLVNEGD